MPENEKGPILKKPRSIRAVGREFMDTSWQWLIGLLDLKEGMDREGTIISIKTGKRMRGANAWMLMCSIMIASLGLDLNSPAIIIGAMLISPLMTPILGIGLGVSTNDRETLLLSFKNLMLAMVIALATSFIYFLLSPLNYGLITDEVRARTAPTILDGLVAVFGGLAGVISTTRKDKTNAIPGVAIATALMPPLCVTGFGLVYGLRYNSWTIAYNSFYLFFLNSFIIALTTYFIFRLLRFPYRTYPDKTEAQRARSMVIVFIFLMLIPGIYSLIDIANELSYKKKVNEFIQTYFQNDCSDYKIFKVGEDSTLLVMQLVNRTISDDSITFYNNLIHTHPYNLPADLYIKPIPDFSIELNRLDRMQYRLSNLDDMARKIQQIDQQQRLQAQEYQKLKSSFGASITDSVGFNQLRRQLSLTFPEVTTLSFGNMRHLAADTTVYQKPMLLVEWENGPKNASYKSQVVLLDSFLRISLPQKELQIMHLRESR